MLKFKFLTEIQNVSKFVKISSNVAILMTLNTKIKLHSLIYKKEKRKNLIKESFAYYISYG